MTSTHYLKVYESVNSFASKESYFSVRFYFFYHEFRWAYDYNRSIKINYMFSNNKRQCDTSNANVLGYNGGCV